jgi:hypothetical protein
MSSPSTQRQRAFPSKAPIQPKETQRGSKFGVHESTSLALNEATSEHDSVSAVGSEQLSSEADAGPSHDQGEGTHGM